MSGPSGGTEAEALTVKATGSYPQSMAKDNVTPITRKRIRKKAESQAPIPQNLPQVDLEKLAQYSMTRMSVRHMCLMLKITEGEFVLLKETDKGFRDALELGRAEACHSCALVLVKATQGTLGSLVRVTDPEGNVKEYREFGDREREQIKSARDYLSHHAPLWLTDKT